ncbi:MAG: O-antigen ligase family protein [Ruminococcus sp.]|nr:O-antigen ligase family protein [Ruminococcus sp.]
MKGNIILMSNVKLNSKKNKDNLAKKQRYSVKHALVNYYLILMFTIFPLFYTDAYFNIRKDKYFLFLVASGIIIFSMFAITLTYKQDSKTSLPKQSQVIQPLHNMFTIPEWAMLAFLLVSFVSTLLSPTPLYALLGTGGRNNGLLLIAVYTAVFFIVSRIYYFKEYVFLAFGVASSIVYVLAVLNSFYIDPLSMAVDLSQRDLPNFVSTIGNKNMLSSYICVTLPVFISMSVHTNKLSKQIVYLIVSGLGFTALMAADSDSGILGLVAFFVIYLIVYARRIARLKKYFLALAIMFASAKIINLFIATFEKNKGFDSFQNFFISSNAGHLLLVAVSMIAILLYIFDHIKPNTLLPKAVPIVLCAICAIAIVAAIVGIIYFTFIDTETKLKNLAGLLRINDKWGTHRGYMWIRSMWIFSDYSFIEKLFGCGPDCFYFAFQPYFEGLQKFGDSSTNAAHNEYINYLITTGILGLGAYLTLVISVIVRAIKSAAKNPLALVFAASVICYSVQAVVNISQPITTPLFILFLALCEAVTQNKAFNKI